MRKLPDYGDDGMAAVDGDQEEEDRGTGSGTGTESDIDPHVGRMGIESAEEEERGTQGHFSFGTIVQSLPWYRVRVHSVSDVKYTIWSNRNCGDDLLSGNFFIKQQSFLVQLWSGVA